MNIIENLEKRNLINPPKWLHHAVQYLIVGGSTAYGCNKTNSDWDVIGWCIPPKEDIFPHLKGEILGFGRQHQRFDQYLQHGIDDKDKGRNYDINCFSIVKFFNLVLENNPNLIETLFVAQDCVLVSTEVGQLVRENRKMFLHKGAWPKHKGYAFSQMHKMSSQERTGKRKENYELYGFDTKFAAHTVRLLLQVEQILSEGDMDLRRNSDHLKAIRNGEVSEEEIRKWFSLKEVELEKLYNESKLPWGPDEPKIKDLLLKCLESHYGSLDKCIERIDKYEVAIRKIKEVTDSL